MANKLPPEIAGAYDMNQFVGILRDVVNDEIDSRVPGAVEKAISEPDGTYSSTVVQVAKKIQGISLVTDNIYEDTQYIRKAIKRIEKKNDLTQSSGPGLVELFTESFVRLLPASGVAALGVRLLPLMIVALEARSAYNRISETYTRNLPKGESAARDASITSTVVSVFYGLVGAAVGFMVGGPVGAVIGAAGTVELTSEASDDWGDTVADNTKRNQLKAKANSGTYADKVAYVKYLKEVYAPQVISAMQMQIKRGTGTAWEDKINQNAQSTINDVQELVAAAEADAQSSLQTSTSAAYPLSKVKDDAVFPAPPVRPFNLNIMFDNLVHPRQDENYTILVANYNDIKSPNHGQLLRISYVSPDGLNHCEFLTGAMQTRSVVLDDSLLANKRRLTLQQTEVERDRLNRLNDKAAELWLKNRASGGSGGDFGGGSGSDTLSGSGAGDKLGPGSAATMRSITNMFSRGMSSLPTDALGGYMITSGYIDGGGHRVPYGASGGVGGPADYSHLGPGGVPSTKTMVYDPLSGQLIDAGPSGGGKGSGSGGDTHGWWTPERQAYAVDYLKKHAGLSQAGAVGLVTRWTFEAPQGPTSSNNIGGGHWGIAQWGQARGGESVQGMDFDGQLAKVVGELNGSEDRAAKILRSATNADEASRGSAAYERAGGYDSTTNTDLLYHDVVKRYDSVAANQQSYVDANAFDGRSVTYQPKLATDANDKLDNIEVLRGHEKGVDPRLINVMDAVAGDFPPGYKIKMISGKDARSTGTLNHPNGLAMDFQIFDEKGNLLPHDRNSPGWSMYERMYRAAEIRAGAMYPGMHTLWGGTWQSAAAGNGDPMHIQVLDPSVKGSSQTMNGYDWETGLKKTHSFYASGNHMTEDQIKEWDAQVRKRVSAEIDAAKAEMLSPVATNRTGIPVRSITDGKPVKPVAPIAAPATKDDDVSALVTRIDDLEKKVKAADNSNSNKNETTITREVKESRVKDDLPSKVKDHTYQDGDPQLGMSSSYA